MKSQTIPTSVVSILSKIFNPNKLNTKAKLLPAGSIMAIILTLGLLLALFSGGERVSSKTEPICVDGLGPVLPDVFKVCPVSGDPPTSPFSIRERWRTGNITIEYQTPVLGDLYGTGQPVAVTASNTAYNAGATGVQDRRAQNLNIVDGATGAVLDTIVTPFFAWSGHSPMAIADVDGDGQGEIILKAHHQTDVPAAQRGRLIAYRNDGTVMWVSDQRYDHTAALGRSGGSLALADFNADGVPEVYIGNQVFNALTGARLAAGAAAGSAGCGYLAFTVNRCDTSQVTAADMDGDGQLELLAGNVVYKVNITNPDGEAGNSLTVWQQASAVAGMGDAFTAVADIDLDGDPDVIGVRWAPTTGNTILFVWDGQTNQVMDLVTSIGTNGGAPLIGDIDNDGAPEIVIQNVNQLRAFDFVAGPGFVGKWNITTADSSGQTSLSMFDFNNDGIKELVYRDQELLRILNGSGSTATNLATFPCISGTHTDMPIIGDIDGSGEARILVSCRGGTTIEQGQLRAYETNSFPWANTRPVWNQQAYFATHINEDLTVPAPQFPHWTGFADPTQNCSGGTNRPLNAFQQQITDLDPDTGCPVLCPPVEYGDAPDSYGTLSINNGARHGILNFDEVTGTAPLMFGSTISHEPDGQPSQPANVDSDDGVATLPPYLPGGGRVCTGTLGTYTTGPNEYCAVVAATNTGPRETQAVGWLDSEGDGDFADAGNRSVPINNPAVDDGTFTTGNLPVGTTRNIILVWQGLPSTLPLRTYFRFRLTSDASFLSDTSPQPNGSVSDGEVEDYVLLQPTAANVNISGRVMTAGGRGLARAQVTLTDLQDGSSRTTVSSVFGYYGFTELQAGRTYFLSVSLKGYQFAPQTVTAVDDISELDFIAQE